MKPTGTEARVCADIAARQQIGIAKYGCTVEQSPDDMLTHAYQESLDLAVYLKAEIERRDAKPAPAEPIRYTGHVPCAKCGKTHWMYAGCTPPAERPTPHYGADETGFRSNVVSERPTPITDAVAKWGDMQGYEVVPSDVARDLERQLAEARLNIEVERERADDAGLKWKQATEALAECTDQRDRLAEALEHAVKRIRDFENYIEGKRCGPPATDAALKFAEIALSSVKGGPK